MKTEMTAPILRIIRTKKRKGIISEMFKLVNIVKNTLNISLSLILFWLSILGGGGGEAGIKIQKNVYVQKLQIKTFFIKMFYRLPMTY